MLLWDPLCHLAICGACRTFTRSHCQIASFLLKTTWKNVCEREIYGFSQGWGVWKTGRSAPKILWLHWALDTPAKDWSIWNRNSPFPQGWGLSATFDVMQIMNRNWRFCSECLERSLTIDNFLTFLWHSAMQNLSLLGFFAITMIVLRSIL